MRGLEKIIGYSDIKEELSQILDILQNKERYLKIGVKPPSGLLLYGVPGVGKTLMAKSLAEASGWKTYYCRKNETTADFIKKLKNTFRKAAETAPSIVILDDMDKYADAMRFKQNVSEYVAIQTCIDEVKGKNVFVVATANNKYVFPDSLVRAGRFDRTIEVNVPKGKDAVDIVSHYLGGKAFVKEVDAQVVARIMDGQSCAALEKVINEAGVFAGYKKSNVITMEHFLEACMRTVFHTPSGVMPRYDDEYYTRDNLTVDLGKKGNLLPQIICHETGHAVLSEILCPGSVTLISSYCSNGEEGGFTSFYQDENIDHYSWIESRIISALGGMAAVEQNFGTVGIGAACDLDQAFQYVRYLVESECVCGFALHGIRTPGSEDLRSRQEQAVALEIEKYYRRAKELLSENSSFFKAVEQALKEKQLLSAVDIKRIREKLNSNELFSDVSAS